MSVWIVEAEIAILLFAIALPIAVGPMVYLHYRRYGTFKAWPALLSFGALLYFWGLVAFTLFPLPATDEEFCTLREEVSFWQLRPFASIGAVADVAAESGFVEVLTSPVFLQVAFNILLLVPLGAYLAFRYRKGLAFTAMAGLGVSLLIELTQGTGVWGLYGCPYRLADVDDLATNTLGAVVGWMIGTALVRLLPDPDPPSTSDTGPPSVARRAAAFLLDLVYFVLLAGLIQTSYLIMTGGDPDGPPGPVVAMASVASGVVLMLLVPLLRLDRATPGQIATWLGVANNSNTTRGATPRVATGWLLRWGPLLTVGLLQPVLALVAVIAAELLMVVIRNDRRSLSAFLSRTQTVVRRQLTRDSS